MRRLLCIVSSLDTGGAETFMMKIFRGLPQNYKLDFIVSTSSGYYEEEVKQLGGKIFRVPLRTKSPLKTFKEIKYIVKNNNYQIVLKLCDTSIGIFDLLASKCGGAKKLCVRSCNASSSENKVQHIFFKILRPFFNKITDIKIAPSKLAAEYTFGKKCIENNKVILLNNGLNTKQFTYSKDNRFEIRRELGIENKIVVGHIGRFDIQKNHEFLIDVFNELHKVNSDSILVLVGKGNLENKIKEKVKKLGLENDVLFLGVRKDVPKLLCAFDLFLFPSFYEGMPNTVIEAQTTGLPCLISNSITEGARVTNIVNFASLNDSTKKWINECLSILNKKYLPREDYSRIMKDKGYDIDDCAKKFIEIIFNSND